MGGSLTRRFLYAAATSPRLEHLARRQRWVERAAYRAALRYVAGSSLSDAIRTIERLRDDGLAASLDVFGESVSDPAAVERVVGTYAQAAAAIGGLNADVYLEIVPSHLGIDVSVDFCRRHVERILELLPEGARLHVSAEESRRTPSILEVTVALRAGGGAVMQTLQANLRRSPRDADRLAEAGVPVRLVKGAYMEPSEVALPWGEACDVAYVHLAHRLHAAGAKVALGTHDPVIRESLLAALPGVSVEMLLGVRPEDAQALVRRGHHVRIYVPFGNDWFRYWLRRVAEGRGA